MSERNKDKPAGDAPRPDGRFAYEGLERLMHERSRLGILTSLASHPDGLAFNDLKKLCSLTDGNLSRQLTLLEEAGLLEVSKTAAGNTKRPLTRCTLTDKGRRRFLEYIAELERVVADAAETRAAAAAGALPRRLSTA